MGRKKNTTNKKDCFIQIVSEEELNKEQNREQKKPRKKKKTWIMKYEINGYRYTFEDIYLDNGVPYGYCRKLGIWAWLYRDSISHFGPDVDVVPAKRLTKLEEVEK